MKTTSKRDAENTIELMKYQFVPDYETVQLIKALFNYDMSKGCGDWRFALVDIYNLGRIHGIREERAKRKG